MSYWAVVDIGGTHTRIGVSKKTELLLDVKTHTPQDYNKAVQLIVTNINELANRQGVELEAVAVGVPGTLTGDFRRVFHAPNLPLWKGKELAADLSAALTNQSTSATIPVFLANDTELLALGESLQPECRKYKVVGFLAIGTGVGGARIVNGKIDSNYFGFEPGHQIMDFNTGQDWEALIGGRSIQQATGMLPDDIKDDEFWYQKHRILAQGVYNITLLWSPEVFIFGGGLFDRGTYKLDMLHRELEKINTLVPTLPQMLLGQLGDDSGLVGAAHYLNHKLKTAHGKIRNTS